MFLVFQIDVSGSVSEATNAVGGQVEMIHISKTDAPTTADNNDGRCPQSSILRSLEKVSETSYILVYAW